MHNHAPTAYDCPFCRLAAGEPDPITSRLDVVRQTATAPAFISPRWWPRNHGHVIVVPTAHYENLYELDPVYGHGVHDLCRAA